MSIFVKNFEGETKCYSISSIERVVDLYALIRARESLPCDESWFLSNSIGLKVAESSIQDGETFHIRCRMLGGKGGFGAELRLQSKKRGPKPVTNFGACRDLSGRRLRHVNDAILIQKFQEANQRGEKFDPTTEKTQSGIESWFLGTPSWADVKKRSPSAAFQQGKRKTELCPNWLEARRTGKPPSNAPSWWGCHRGKHCKFAHGENDLERVSLLKYREGKRKEQLQEKRNQIHAYVNSVTDSYYLDEDLCSMVSQGLAQANKRRKIDTESSIKEKADGLHDEKEGETMGEVTFDGDFPLLCVSGDVDVTGCLVDLSSGGTLSLDHADNKGNVRGEEAAVAVKSIDRYHCEGISSFGTVIVPGLALQSGNYYYEITLITDGIMQIGWASSPFLDVNAVSKHENDAKVVRKVEGDGCGDDLYSFGYCGQRGLLFHSMTSTQLGKSSPSSSSCNTKIWHAGQVLGCAISLTGINRACKDGEAEDKKKEKSKIVSVCVSYTLDGTRLEPLLPAKTFCINADEGFFPALSLEAEEKVEVNLGTTPFQHCPDGFVAVSAAFDSYNDNEDASNEEQTVPCTSISESALVPIDLEKDIKPHSSAASLQAHYTADHLKWELQRRGLKAGGSHQERACRLFAVKGLAEAQISNKIRAKKSIN